MVEQSIPEVRFDDELARTIYPRPALKNSVLVHIPHTKKGSEIPTFIEAEWGDIQVFFGDYYAIVTDGTVAYGSAKDQWEAMHTLIQPGYWVKTAIPTAYQAAEACRIVTLIPTDDGSVREANYVLEPGDWVVRQPGGEVQHVKASKFDGIYFSDEEAESLGLTQMSIGEFAQWATDAVRNSVSIF